MLLHTCCGPCACYPTAELSKQGIKPRLYFYNPNIHPYLEQKSRRESFKKLAQLRNLEAIIEPGYDLEEFLKEVAIDPAQRCIYCYRVRLAKTAAKARELSLASFSTTLLISPYQNRELILEMGHQLAKDYGLQFQDPDFRSGFRQSQAQAKEYDLYRQKYCGCIYSEKERYYREQKLPNPPSGRSPN